MSKNKYILIWFFGFILSLLIFPDYFVESAIPVRLNNDLGIYLPTPGSLVRWRTEGWGTTKFGKYGIASIDDLKDIHGNVIGIWGDSHIEGLHVDDSLKIAQQLTKMLKKNNNFVAIGIGQSGYAITDYYYLIPQYEKLAKFKHHFIVFTNFNDLLPDEYQFFSIPKYKLIHKPRKYGFITIRNVANKWKLNLPYIITRKILKDDKNKTRKMHFRVGKVSAIMGNIKMQNNIDKIDAFNFILQNIKEISEIPITFIYAPNLPIISKNQIVDKLSAENKENVLLFSTACQRSGFQFIDISDSFKRYFYKSGHKIPNGFNNSFPGSGHWNKHGHFLVAKSIYEVINE